MLKEREARLLPEAMAEQQRGINGGRQHGSGDRLRDVVKWHELFRAHLIMKLETGVAGLHHHVVMRDLQFVNALDVNIESASAQLADRAVQFEVARIGREILQRKIG